jgi:hypothetical protein
MFGLSKDIQITMLNRVITPVMPVREPSLFTFGTHSSELAEQPNAVAHSRIRLSLDKAHHSAENLRI